MRDKVVTGRARCGLALASLLALLGASGPVSADFITTVDVTNNTGVNVFDLDASFTGTGGMIRNPQILVNQGTPATIAATPMMTPSMIHIVWKAPGGLPNTKMVEFNFETPYGIIGFAGGNWTGSGGQILQSIQMDRDRVSVTSAAVPEPASGILLGLGILGVSGIAWHRRKRADRTVRISQPAAIVEAT